MSFERGQKVRDKIEGLVGTMLGPEDFDGYERNQKFLGKGWVLIRWDNGRQTWAADMHLELA